MFTNSEYVIDFERVNQLTSHPNDSPISASYAPTFGYGITRKILKEYLEIYTNPSSRKTTREEYLSVVEILHYNKVLVSKSDMRDKNIDKVLDVR